MALRCGINFPPVFELTMGSCSYIFGPYVLSPSGDLRKHDLPLKLQRKPLAVLRALLEGAGDTVKRQDLQARLWPSDTFVDFDQGLNAAIKKLRDVLCDSADAPRYIETVPGVGYRFIHPIATVAARQDRPTTANSGESALAAVEMHPESGKLHPPPLCSEPDAVPVTEPEPLHVGSSRPGTRWWHWSLALGTAAVALVLSISLKSGNKPHPQERPRTVRLVVLPFESFTGDTAPEYFCEGLTEELIAQLGALDAQKLQVVARASAMHYKGSSLTAREIGAELKADYIVSGAVRHIGPVYRITVQLTDTRSQTNDWSGSFDRELRNILDVHRDIALAVGREIGDRISPHFQHPALGTQPVNPLAHDAYLRARFLWNKRTVSDLRDSVDEFNKALAIDPDYPEAHAGLADAYAVLTAYGGLPIREGYSKARVEAEKALRLNPHSAEARTSLAFVEAYYYWQFAQAEQDFRAAVNENPNYATGHQWYGMFLSQRGRHEQAIMELERAAQLDPFSLAIGVDLANAYTNAGRYDDAERQLLKTRSFDPNYFGTYGAMAGLYAVQGRVPEAERENQKLKELSGNYSGDSFLMAYAYARAGQPLRARELLRQVAAMKQAHGDRSPCAMQAYLVLGDDDAALKCLDDGVRQRADWVVPLLESDELRNKVSDPRFRARLSEAGLLAAVTNASISGRVPGNK